MIFPGPYIDSIGSYTDTCYPPGCTEARRVSGVGWGGTAG